MRMIGDLVISRARLGDTLAPDRAARAAGRVARGAGEQRGDRAPAARPARRGDARAPGPGRRDLPPHAVRRPRPGARNSTTKVRLVLQGQETEIDKFLIERMMDPVLHLVRNAVSHGVRAAGGAASPRASREEGTLTLSAAARRRHRCVLEIADDGRGIDAEAVRRARAAALGLAVPDGPLDDATLLGSDLRARVLDARRDRSRQRPRRRHGRRARRPSQQLNGTLALRHGAGRGHPLRHRAAADAVDHRRADRDGRRPDVRGAAGVGPRGHRARAVGAAGRSRTHEIAPYRGGVAADRPAQPAVRDCRAAAARAARVRRRHRPRRRGHRRRSHHRAARDRRADDGRRADQGRGRLPARPISATGGWC